MKNISTKKKSWHEKKHSSVSTKKKKSPSIQKTFVGNIPAQGTVEVQPFSSMPKPLLDIKEFLPEGIAPAQNGIIPPNKLKKVYCGGQLYIDAARSWEAMVRAAALDDVFLNLNHPVNAYRNITVQIKRFENRFEEIDATEVDENSKFLQVKFSGKIWQIKPGATCIGLPGEISNGFGLAVYIRNAAEEDVKNWLDENAEQFGFVKEYNFEPGHYAYIKAREEIPERVLEIENLPPEPTFSAEQISEVSGCAWINEPSQDWTCNGLLSSEPFRVGCLTVANQGAGIGIRPELFDITFRQCAGIICTNPEPFEEYKIPLLVTLNLKETVEKLSVFFEETGSVDDSEDESQGATVPTPLFDIEKFLPEEITPALNGIIPTNKLKKIYCGGELYKDAARSWTAMVRAADSDGIFLNLNFAVDAYRNLTAQIKRFKDRYEKIDATEINPDSKFIQAEFNGKIWQLKKGKNFFSVPGQDPHGFALSVYIKNANEKKVKNWLNENAEQFGFVRGYKNKLREYVYIKAREEIPARVLEIENLPPEPKFFADQISEITGCAWINPPQAKWNCRGLFSSEPFRTGYLAVINQGAGIGIKGNRLENTYKQCAGIICSNPKPFEKYKRPMLVTLNVRETVEKLSAFFEESAQKVSEEETTLMAEFARPLFDIKNYLPEGITPIQNGIIPADRLKKIYCGGELYTDAARSWTAMVRAAAQEGIFLNLNFAVDAYRNITAQIKRFKDRFEEIDATEVDENSKFIQAEFGGKIWQLKKGKKVTDIPGQSSHGFGLAVYIKNADEENVQDWLEKNSESFGFVKEYDHEPNHYAYIKAQEEIPSRVLEIERQQPEPSFSAEKISEVSGCAWITPPPADWICHGLFSEEPFRTGYLAVIKQGTGIGIDEELFKSAFKQCAGIICTDPGPFVKYRQPILVALNLEETVQKLSDFFEKTAKELSPEKNIVDSPLKFELDFYKKTNPETVIFQRKKILADKLLKISVFDLKSASEQFWYSEYLALLAIRIKNPALVQLGKKYVKELLNFYRENAENDNKALAVLGMLQFINPVEMSLPIDRKLWSREMRADVRGIFLNYYPKVCFADDDISLYYVSRQKDWRHTKRKMRVLILLNSTGSTNDKLFDVYEEFKRRENVEVFFVLHPASDYHYNESVWQKFHDKYPDDIIYDSGAIGDLKSLNPDYVFLQHSYEENRKIPTLSCDYIVQFAKICHVSYGLTLSHTFTDRLFDDYPFFYRNLYLFFCSGETVKKDITARFETNAKLNWQHFEFMGYPILEKYYLMPAVESSSKRILWTPRWNYDPKVGGSHFMDYKESFISLKEKYGEKISLAMRPHQRTFAHHIAKGVLTQEEVDDYKARLAENQIEVFIPIDTEIDENIHHTDIFLADYSSMLIVLFLTGRPIIYCEFPNAEPFPEYEEMFDAMYLAHTWEDIEGYLDDLINGKDPLQEKRLEVAKKLYETHKNATRRIVDRVVKDFEESQV